MCLSEILKVLIVPILELTQPPPAATQSHKELRRFCTFSAECKVSCYVVCLSFCLHLVPFFKNIEMRGGRALFGLGQPSQVSMVNPCNAFQWDLHIANVECCCPFYQVSFQLHSYAFEKTSASVKNCFCNCNRVLVMTKVILLLLLQMMMNFRCLGPTHFKWEMAITTEYCV